MVVVVVVLLLLLLFCCVYSTGLPGESSRRARRPSKR